MAITFPRDIPSELKVADLEFMLEPMVELNASRGGKQYSADLGPALWRMKINAPVQSIRDLDAVRAWRDTLLDEEFYAYDKARQYPAAYETTGFTGLMVGASAFTGNCILTDVQSNNVEVTLGSLPIGFVFSRGDYIAFDYGASSRALHRISAAATANGSGVAVVEVRPHIRPGWQVVSPAVRTVYLYRAAARMVIVPGSYSESVGRTRVGAVSFEAIQTL